VWEAVFVEGLVTVTVWKIADVAAVEPLTERVCVIKSPSVVVHWIAAQVNEGQLEVAASKTGVKLSKFTTVSPLSVDEQSTMPVHNPVT